MSNYQFNKDTNEIKQSHSLHFHYANVHIVRMYVLVVMLYHCKFVLFFAFSLEWHVSYELKKCSRKGKPNRENGHNKKRPRVCIRYNERDFSFCLLVLRDGLCGSFLYC